jgi:7-cyano-7-deazaguanine synthase
MSSKASSRKRCVVLLSGGLDSATALFIAKKQGFQPQCLVFDYGQRHDKEINCALKLARAAGCPCQVIRISLPWKGSLLLEPKAALKRAKSPSDIPGTYVPARNTIFLSFALSFAEAIDAEAIFIGANAVDYSGYPDCRPDFYRAFQKVILKGTKAGVEKRKISIKTPLINLTKAGIIRRGVSLGVPYELTWSCYSGKALPCGKCESCFYRAKGFKEAGINDPALGAR